MHKYMSIDQLAEVTTYSKTTLTRGTISKRMVEGIHYVCPFGGKKKLYIWEAIERDMFQVSQNVSYASGEFRKPAIPMANGGVCHG